MAWLSKYIQVKQRDIITYPRTDSISGDVGACASNHIQLVATDVITYPRLCQWKVNCVIQTSSVLPYPERQISAQLISLFRYVSGHSPLP